MPVEIKELIIRANIVNSNCMDSEPNSEDSSGEDDCSAHGQKEAIIAACVAQVLKILERKQER